MQAQIPEEYVPDAGLRLKLYRRLADIQSDGRSMKSKKSWQIVLASHRHPSKICCSSCILKSRRLRARLASIAVEDGRIVIKYGREDEVLSARLTKRFKIRAARDRAWLELDGADKWRAHLSEVVRGF